MPRGIGLPNILTLSTMVNPAPSDSMLALIRGKLGIGQLNDMQLRAYASSTDEDLLLLAPTGTGKTLAFTLSMLRTLRSHHDVSGPVAVIIAPARELALQIYSVVRPLAEGRKTVVMYGGHNVADETASLTPVPDIVIATPGRLLDQLQRGNLSIHSPACLVLDEYDKILQLGFEDEVSRLMRRIGKPRRIILTSATCLNSIPTYLGLDTDSTTIEYNDTDSEKSNVEYVEVRSYTPDKLHTLADLLASMPSGERVIVFVNHRESAERVAAYLRKLGFPAALYHGALDQRQRATAVDTLQAGATPIMVATDLAARGLDINSLYGVIHYHMPVDREAWIHRNGRTGRQGASGHIWVITGPDETLPVYVTTERTTVPESIDESTYCAPRASMSVICLSAGKKEKISKGDVAGFIAASEVVKPWDIGLIRVYDHYSLAAVPADCEVKLLAKLRLMRLKGKKVRVSIA